jgi:hypothetical protein
LKDTATERRLKVSSTTCTVSSLTDFEYFARSAHCILLLSNLGRVVHTRRIVDVSENPSREAVFAPKMPMWHVELTGHTHFFGHRLKQQLKM